MKQASILRNYVAIPRSLPVKRSPRTATAIALLAASALGLVMPASAQTEGKPFQIPPALTTDALFAIASLAEESIETLPDAGQWGLDEILAFEENARFVYLAGRRGLLHRRVVLLKPGTVVVEDRIRVAQAGIPVAWALLANGQVELDGGKFTVSSPTGDLSGETLLPKNTVLQPAPQANDAGSDTSVLVATARPDIGEARFLHVFHIRRPSDQGPRPHCKLTTGDDGMQLVVEAAETMELRLPAERDAAGTLAIIAEGDRKGLPRRLLPSGIMPHGREGVRLMQRWDVPYHNNRRPGWDTGRVAPELKRTVEEGVVRSGRAVVLGCGTGTNAIYLARRGFDVTGVDVAPTALARAEEKAREADVDVRWVLADVLSLPDFEPFDLVFDRGCYHHVRQYNAAGCVESVRGLSQPGSRVLILAGSDRDERRGGPPRIKETEIRTDFSPLFTFQWLREIRFDSVNPGSKGPSAWSVLLRRKAEP